MLRRLAILLLTMLGFPVMAQTATFDVASSTLEIPSLRIADGTVYSNIQLVLPPGGRWSLSRVGRSGRAVAVSDNIYPLATTITNYPQDGNLLSDTVFLLANGQSWTGCDLSSFSLVIPPATQPEVTLYQIGADEFRLQFKNSLVSCSPAPIVYSASVAPVADFQVSPDRLAGYFLERLSFVVVGGVPPYLAVSSNGTVATVTSLTQSPSIARASGIVTLSSRAGEADIVISDAAGGILRIPVTCQAQPSATVSTVALAIEPAEMNALFGEQLVFGVGGGAAPYQVSSSNPGLVKVVAVTHDSASARAVITAEVVGTVGSAEIDVVDATGKLVKSTVTVSPGPVSTNELQALPGEIATWQGQRLTLSISGGTPPYQVQSDNASLVAIRGVTQDADVARAVVVADVLGAFGSVSIVVVDGAGATAIVLVRVAANGPASTEALKVTPESISTSQGQRLSLSIAGGNAPYLVQSANAALAAVRSVQHDSTAARAVAWIDILGAYGSTSIGVVDAAGVVKSVPLQIVSGGPSSSQSLQVAPASISAAYGGRVSFSIAGGAAPYVVSSSDNSLVAVLRTDHHATVASAAVTLYITGSGGVATIAVVDSAGNQKFVTVTAK